MSQPGRAARVTAVIVDSGDALQAALHVEPDVEVVAHVRDVATLRDTIWRTVPDAIVVVVEAPIDPVALSRGLTDELPVCRILLATRDGDAPFECVAAGAAAVVPILELLGAAGPVVLQVARGEAILSQQWAQQTVDAYEQDDAPHLTATEREVLQRMARGAASDTIAALHDVPPRLVRLHAAFALAKLHEAARHQEPDPEAP